jgi:hypothetical protein
MTPTNWMINVLEYEPTAGLQHLKQVDSPLCRSVMHLDQAVLDEVGERRALRAIFSHSSTRMAERSG